MRLHIEGPLRTRKALRGISLDIARGCDQLKKNKSECFKQCRQENYRRAQVQPSSLRPYPPSSFRVQFEGSTYSDQTPATRNRTGNLCVTTGHSQARTPGLTKYNPEHRGPTYSNTIRSTSYKNAVAKNILMGELCGREGWVSRRGKIFVDLRRIGSRHQLARLGAWKSAVSSARGLC